MILECWLRNNGLCHSSCNWESVPKNTIICITGYAIHLNTQELGTIMQYQLLVKIILLNNKLQGMVWQW